MWNVNVRAAPARGHAGTPLKKKKGATPKNTLNFDLTLANHPLRIASYIIVYTFHIP